MKDLGVCVMLVASQWYWGTRHRVHYLRHSDDHFRRCTCRGTGRLGGGPYYYPDFKRCLS